MQVSVIIPVYNASRYVRQAAESALRQLETVEVVLVEDGSPDDSLEICRTLAAENRSVKLLRHPNGENRGAAASRNLGMKESTYPFIAFLDADDVYLPGRFSVAKEVFASHADCDGVYEAIGIHYENAKAEQQWLASSMATIRETTMTRRVPPEALFRTLTKGDAGYFSIDGLVIRRSVLADAGYFNEHLGSMHEDTDFVLRLAAVGRLMPGRLDEPVAARRVHSENRISAPRSASEVYRDRLKMWVSVYRWCRRKGLKEHQRLVFERFLAICGLRKPLNEVASRLAGDSAQTALRLIAWPADCADVVREGLYWRELGSSLWGIIRNDLLRWNG